MADPAEFDIVIKSGVDVYILLPSRPFQSDGVLISDAEELVVNLQHNIEKAKLIKASIKKK